MIASRARRFFTSLPCRRMTPLLRVATPKIFFQHLGAAGAVQAGGEADDLAPYVRWKETSRSLEYMAVRALHLQRKARRRSSLSLGGKRFVSSRPTISLMMMRSIVISAAGSVGDPRAIAHDESLRRRYAGSPSILWEI